MKTVTYDQLKALRASLGVPWFTKAWDINLVILRSDSVGQWDDLVAAACLDDAGRQVVQCCVATGDASPQEWLNPTHEDGCVYVVDQHVQGGLELGLHRGRDALVQRREFRNVRWPRGMGMLPTPQELEELSKVAGFEDFRGTNLHNRVNYSAPLEMKAYDGQGCTVTLYRHQHAALLELVRTQHEFLGSSVVSPTYTRWSVLEAL
jgi:hypothetical protein